MASSPPGAIFDRLVGLETEYAIRFRPGPGRPTPSKFELFQALAAALGARLPVIAARAFKEGRFLATGGAIWFEAERPAAGAGLIEGATPECRGPTQLLTWQRAQDRLLAEAAREAGQTWGGSFTLLKNDRDSRGNVYGAQENYEATVAEGWRLAAWRTALVALLPLVLLTWLGFGLLIGLLLIYLLAASAVYWPLRWLTGDRRRWAERLFGRDAALGRETGGLTPPWLETLIAGATRLVCAPLAVAVWALAAALAFRRQRAGLLPFLASRCVLAGAGLVDRRGRLQLADKAPAINRVTGLGGFLHDRPLFCFGHCFKGLVADLLFSPRAFAGLWRRRQRLQIGLGDSNMCQTAELLRVGTTLLVLDALEHGELPPPPALRRPLTALRVFCRDPSLRAAAPLRRGGAATAVQIQRFYLDACRRMVGRRPDAPEEAREIIRLWTDMLSALERAGDAGEPPQQLVGHLDWATKRYLLARAGTGAPWAVRKKIDLRYHELSPEGYYSMLESAGIAAVWADPAEVERAMRTPPSDSPATARGRFIREFAGGDQPLRVDWRSLTIGSGWGARTIRLDRYVRRAGRPATSSVRGPT